MTWPGAHAIAIRHLVRKALCTIAGDSWLNANIHVISERLHEPLARWTIKCLLHRNNDRPIHGLLSNAQINSATEHSHEAKT